MSLRIYLESRVCVELGFKYNAPGNIYTSTLSRFSQAWSNHTRYPEAKLDQNLKIIGEDLQFTCIEHGWFDVTYRKQSD